MTLCLASIGWATWRLHEDQAWVNHSHAVQARALSALAHFERLGAARLQADSASGAAFERSRERLQEDLARLTALVRDNPAQQKRLATIRAAQAAWLNETKSEASPTDRRMAPFREAVAPFIEAERRLLAERQDRLRHEFWGLGGGVFGIFSLTLLAATVAGRRQLKTAEAAESARRESEALFQSAFAEAASGMTLTHARNHWQRVNPWLERWLGYAPGTLKLEDWERIMHPEDMARIQLALPGLYSGELPAYRTEARYRSLTGEVLWGALTVTIVHDALGEPRLMLTQVQDLNELKAREAALAVLNSQLAAAHEELALSNEELTAANEELTAANEELTAANEEIQTASEELTVANEELRAQSEHLESANARLRSVDRMKADFVSAVSHELRTPLTSIQGYAEFLEDGIGGELNPAQGEFLREIVTATSRLRLLVDDLLDFARLEAGTFQLTPQPVELGAIVKGVVGSLAPQALAASVSLTAELEVEFAELEADPHRLEQVLINLVSNALKFTPAGGAVQVHLTRAPGRWRLAVRDSGVGIAPEHQARLFEKFYQVDGTLTREHGGAGLGLAIVKAIVEAHRGTVVVASSPGTGSTFTVELPAGGLLEAAVPAGSEERV